MNILVITPFYRIEGRPDLIQDTSAVHYLVKPWAKEHNVRVIYIYRNYFRKITRYLDGKARQYYSRGYEYQADGVNVFLIEEQRVFKQPLFIDRFQGKRIRRMISGYLAKYDFIPDLVITHIPTETDGMIEGMFAGTHKVAVLHSSDVKFCDSDSKRYDLLKHNHDYYFARSRGIRDYFLNRGMDNVSRELILSGVPKVETVIRDCLKPHKFRIVYAGKFIPRKHIDLAVKALAILKDKYSFQFDLYGVGREESKIRLLAQDLLGDIAIFHGQVSRDEMLKIMEEADIFIMPSTQETFGLVYIEAMSKGCIPIGVEGEGIDGVIQDGVNGFLVLPNSVKNIVEKLTAIFQMDEQGYKSFVQEVMRYGGVYNETDMGYRYLNLILNSSAQE